MENNGYIYESKPNGTGEAAAAPVYDMPKVENISAAKSDYKSYLDEMASKPVIYKPRSLAETRARIGANAEAKSHLFSLPARVGMWTVGIIAGLTIIFGCVVIWILGLDYLGVIDKAPKKNDTYNFYIYGDNSAVPQTPSAGGDYEDFENFLEDFFGSGGANGGYFINPFGGEQGGTQTEPQAGTPGLGIKAVEITLDFAIEDKYTAGVVIDTIEEYSSFVGTPVKENDLIVAAEGKTVTTVAQLKQCYANKSVGDEIDLVVARYSNGVASTFEVTVKLVAMQ